MPASVLRRAFAPQSIALIGATDRPGSLGSVLLESLSTGFGGALDLVNRSGRPVAGRRTLAHIDDLPETPDLAVVAVPAEGLVETLQALRARGCPAAVIVSDAQRTSASGRVPPSPEDLRAAAGPMRLIGPGSLGMAAPWLGLHASIARIRPSQGGLAFVGQSATAAGPLVDWAEARGIGFSHIVSLGDMIDIDYADVLNHFADERRVEAVVVHVERLSHARRFLSAARALSRIKPVIAIHAPADEETPARMAVVDAAFERAGMLRVQTLDDVFDAVEAFLARLPADARPSAMGDRLAILANGASMATLAAQSVRGAGVRLAQLSAETEATLSALTPSDRPARNPVNLYPDADPARYRAALDAVLDDKDVDAVLVLAGPTGVADGGQTAEAIAEGVAARRNKPGARKPWVFTSWPGGAHEEAAARVFDAAHIPHFRTPADAVRAFGHLVRHRRTALALTETPTSRPESFVCDVEGAHRAIEAGLARGADTLDRSGVDAVLSAYNIERVRDGETASSGGDTTVLRVAASVDPDFGPIVRVKLADPVGRRLDPGAAALPPLTSALALQTLKQGAAGRLLNEADGARNAAALIVQQVSRIIAEHGAVSAITLDPIYVRGDEARVGEARIAIAPSSGDPADRLAIRPYPAHLERVLTDRTGTRYLMRPIRPEDEPAIVALIDRLDPEDLRLRFFQPIRNVSHAFAARLTQIDYDREMALVLTPEGALPGEADIIGVARLIQDSDGESGEYAVTVDSAAQGRGLGRLQMEALIAYGRETGLKRIFGLVLAENQAMLRLCAKLGFETLTDPDDPALRRVTLDLTPARAHSSAT